MKCLLFFVLAMLPCTICFAADQRETDGQQAFVRKIIASLIEKQPTPGFAVADKVVALDNGEFLSRDDFQKAWIELGKTALREPISLDEFFAKIDLKIQPATENKLLMSNKRVLDAYKPHAGDVYCDASRVKSGVKNFIGYGKAFIYVIRKIDGKWTLICVGG